jgi:Flp pilus assembly protein TadD
MNALVETRFPMTVRLAASALATVLTMSGCGVSGVSKTPSRIEIQEEVGFVITEEARIGNTVRADYEEGVRLLEQGQDAEGIELLAKAAEEAPQLSAPRIDLGIAYRHAGDLEAAEQQLQMALQINPEHPVVHNELGIVYRKAGRFAEARKSYEAALAIYPGFHFASRNLAILCDLYLADMECALAQYQAYAETAPDDEEVAMWLADIRNRMNRQVE